MGSGWVSVTTATTINTALLNGNIGRQTLPRYATAVERSRHIVQMETSLAGTATEPEDYQLSYVADTETVEVYDNTLFEQDSLTRWRRVATTLVTPPERDQAVLGSLSRIDYEANPVVLASVQIVPERQTDYVVEISISCLGTDASTTYGFGVKVDDGDIETNGRAYYSGVRRRGLSREWFWTPTDAQIEAGDPVIMYLVGWNGGDGTGDCTIYATHTNLQVYGVPFSTPHTEWRS